ncbi:DUF2017 domain-containing protein [Phycicoccus sp. Soil802]|uniref:DUF2017 domain-containing protein n=1 Tax=Phycicoccus sp. Soil802 TaxID=1736414 RepID=UPI000703B0CC|nr:DUF2017 domain-containing protein [Phycicoccus sp. Soil802]KRF22960.1 hypothetical protein ASG91_16520 [Phycicoccus sp. Soil802]
MARGFKRRDGRFVAKLDAVERGLVVGLMEQVLELVEPEPTAGNELDDDATDGDEFDRIVAGLGGIGMGVSLSAADQAPELSGSVPQPRDPALERIFPTANRQDDQVAAEFRRLTEDGLRARKAANLTTAITALSALEDQKISLEQPQALALLIALTDVRLVLGERLGLKQDDDFDRLEEQVSGLEDDDPAVYALAVYDFLTWLQETLAHALAP